MTERCVSSTAPFSFSSARDTSFRNAFGIVFHSEHNMVERWRLRYVYNVYGGEEGKVRVVEYREGGGQRVSVNYKR